MKRIYSFGRLPSEPDARDYRMSDVVRAMTELKLPERTWHSAHVLDQTTFPHCVGFAWADWGICAPVEDVWDNIMGHNIYDACKLIDGRPLVPGSSVRCGAKVMRARGHFKIYFFASSILEAAEYVVRYGPVVLGTDWYSGMNTPSKLRTIMPLRGVVVGGHAYLWVGVKKILGKTYAVILNSWGTEWGKGGYAYMLLSDLEQVFAHRGEACAATELVLVV